MSGFGSTDGDGSEESRLISDDEVEMLSLDQMRGMYKDMHNAKLSLNQKATVEGCLAEVAAVKQQIAMQAEQMNRLIGMYQTLQGEFNQYRQQRIQELNVKVNGGSTTPEDLDGTNP